MQAIVAAIAARGQTLALYHLQQAYWTNFLLIHLTAATQCRCKGSGGAGGAGWGHALRALGSCVLWWRLFQARVDPFMEVSKQTLNL